MKLLKINELESLNYIELFPGKLSKGYQNEESIYIDDDTYSFIVAAILKGFKYYKPFAPLEIEKRQWISILNELENLKDTIIFQDIESLEEYISIFYKEKSVLQWKVEEYKTVNKSDLVVLIEELKDWIKSQLEINEIITLIGL